MIVNYYQEWKMKVKKKKRTPKANMRKTIEEKKYKETENQMKSESLKIIKLICL